MLSSPPTMTTRQVSLCQCLAIGFRGSNAETLAPGNASRHSTKAHLAKKKSTRSIAKARGTADTEDAEFRSNKSGSRTRSAKGSKRPTSTFDFTKILNLPTDVLLLILEQLEPHKRTYSVVTTFFFFRDKIFG